jgi:hypothetical protein
MHTEYEKSESLKCNIHTLSLEKDIKDDIGVGGNKHLTSEPRPGTKTPIPCRGGGRETTILTCQGYDKK